MIIYLLVEEKITRKNDYDQIFQAAYNKSFHNNKEICNFGLKILKTLINKYGFNNEKNYTKIADTIFSLFLNKSNKKQSLQLIEAVLTKEKSFSGSIKKFIDDSENNIIKWECTNPEKLDVIEKLKELLKKYTK
jgi:hypothetical protein